MKFESDIVNLTAAFGLVVVNAIVQRDTLNLCMQSVAAPPPEAAEAAEAARAGAWTTDNLVRHSTTGP